MLELNNYYNQINDLNDFITVTFVIIDDIYEKVTPAYIKKRRNIDKSIMSDSEIITLSIVGELLTVDSEKAWFHYARKNLTGLFPNFCTRTRFHRTKKSLFKVIEEISKEITCQLNYQYEKYKLIDSMPIPVCHFGRARFHKTFKPDATYGRCASKKETYYGFKLHALVALDGYICDYSITPADVDDRAPIWELTSNISNLTIIGDKGYIGDNLGNELKSEKYITLIAMKRANSKIQFPKAFRQLVFKARRRIETSFSQLSQQLNIQRVLAKSNWGFISRIKNKILAHNICYLINKALNINVDVAKIKELVFG